MAGFWASPEFINSYRVYAARCKAQGFPPMDAEAFYDATKNGQGLIEPMTYVPFTTSDACWCQPFDGPIHPQCPMHGESSKLDSSSSSTLPTAASTAPANVSGGTGQAGRQDGQISQSKLSEAARD